MDFVKARREGMAKNAAGMYYKINIDLLYNI